MFCAKCGKNIPDDSSFCLHCGQRQSTASTDNNISLPSLPPIPSPANKKSANGCSVGGVVIFVFIILLVIGSISRIKEKSNKSQTPANTTPHIQKQESITPPAAKPEDTPKSDAVVKTPAAKPEDAPKSDAIVKTPAAKPEDAPKSDPIVKKAEPIKKNDTPYQAPILDGAVTTYPETAKELKKAGFPKMLKKLGLETIKKANKLMPLAAEKAAKSKKCDAVLIVDISDRSTKGNPIIYVTAKNGTRFYFSEQELKSENSAVSEQEKLAPLLRRHEVMAEAVIKSNLMHPSTYDRHELGVFKSETTAHCNQIIIEFSAKNSFGVELTYLACVQFDKDSNVVGFHMQEKN